MGQAIPNTCTNSTEVRDALAAQPIQDPAVPATTPKTATPVHLGSDTRAERTTPPRATGTCCKIDARWRVERHPIRYYWAPAPHTIAILAHVISTAWSRSGTPSNKSKANTPTARKRTFVGFTSQSPFTDSQRFLCNRQQLASGNALQCINMNIARNERGGPAIYPLRDVTPLIWVVKDLNHQTILPASDIIRT